jgi:hypothetical protein
MNITREAMAFIPCLCWWISSIHQSLTFLLECQALGSTSWSPSQLFTLDQTRMVNQHLKSKWEADSWTWLQSLHLSQLGHPLFWITSTVQTLFG